MLIRSNKNPVKNILKEKNKSKVEAKEVYFHRQVDQPGNFSCPDGEIIDSEKVCDGINHCEYSYDEIGCSYRIDVKDMGEPENINVTVSIIDVLDIR